MTFADRLKLLREEKGLTQQDVANALNVGRPTIAGYETKGKQPDFDKLIRLCELLNTSLDYLLGRSDIRIIIKDQLTPKDYEAIEEVIEELRKKLLNTDNLKFDGKLATKEDIETILDSVKVGIEMAKIKKHRSE